MRSVSALIALLLMQENPAATRMHPWASFPEGSRVTRTTTQEQGGKKTSSEEVTHTRGPEENGSIKLSIKRGAEEGGEELSLLKMTEDGLKELKSVSTKTVKLKVGKETYDCQFEELTASAFKGKWTFKVWSCDKVVVPVVVLQSLAAIPCKKLGEPVLKLEAYYDSGEGEPDFTKYDVVSLDEKAKVGKTDIRVIKLKIDRRMEKTRTETSEALLSLDVPGHVVKWTTALKGGRGLDMKTTIEATSFEVPAKK